MNGNVLDLAGKRFGRLTAFRYVESGKWFCKCDCGNSVTVVTTNLTRGNSKSCGCARNEALFRHGMGSTRVYRVWIAMRQRCENPNNEAFANYGGRGIKVCERWADFANFFADMGLPPPKHQIDRIDNDKGYEPGNCRWVIQKVNLNNKRTSRKVEWQGETLTITQWAERLGYHQRTLFNRLGRGWPVARAFTEPTAKRMN